MIIKRIVTLAAGIKDSGNYRTRQSSS